MSLSHAPVFNFFYVKEVTMSLSHVPVCNFMGLHPLANSTQGKTLEPFSSSKRHAFCASTATPLDAHAENDRRSQIVCHNCKMVGHIAPRCPVNRMNSSIQTPHKKLTGVVSRAEKAVLDRSNITEHSRPSGVEISSRVGDFVTVNCDKSQRLFANNGPDYSLNVGQLTRFDAGVVASEHYRTQ
jgi:hypothetical protein